MEDWKSSDINTDSKRYIRGHIFVVNKETLPIVLSNQVAATGIKEFEELDTLEKIYEANLKSGQKKYFDIVCDILNLRIGDKVFFYEKGNGFHGIYEISSNPFYDKSTIDDNSNKNSFGSIYPFRVYFKKIYYFKNPVPEEMLFSTPEYEATFWIWMYRKSQQNGARAINTLTPEATKTLTELLIKVNETDSRFPFTEDPSTVNKPTIELPIANNTAQQVRLESILRAWIIQNIETSKSFMSILGEKDDIEWFSNNVPYHVSGKNIDILIYHKNFKYTGFGVRYKYSVIELKKDGAKIEDVSQTINYAKWVNSRLTNNDIETVQPILIASKFSQEVINKAKFLEFNNRGIMLVKYYVKNEKEIEFERIVYEK